MLLKWDFSRSYVVWTATEQPPHNLLTPLKLLQQMFIWKSVLEGNLTAGIIEEEPVPCEQ